MIKRLLPLTLAAIITLSPTLAHSGRTDGYGGHYVRTAGKGYKVGTYHYHSGPYAGYSVDYKGQVPEIEKKRASKKSTKKPTKKKKAS